MINIRHAKIEDLDRIMEIYDCARKIMRDSGNPNQWINGYPERNLIKEDIAKNQFYVCENEDGIIVAVFCFVPGPDPTYSYIEDGEWISDSPYYVVHRMGSDGSVKGIAQTCFDWCFRQSPCVRADTHAANKIMQHLLIKNGFKKCGIIYVEDGSPRIAYQKG